MKLRFPIWTRFSLRSLFALMTLCCVVFGTWSVYVNPYRLQQQSLAAVNRLNGVTLPVPDEGPRWHRWLVTKLLGDDAFVRIDAVVLSYQTVGDKDVRALAGLCFLKHLSLDYTQITDAGLASLRANSQLTDLSLKYTNIADRGAEYLSDLPNLQHLILTGTKISDAGVDHLAKLKTLQTMFIRWTRISSEGADRLRKALPDCDIYHHPLIDKVAAAPK